jgi:predicted dienelactone hydrolase
MRAPDYDPFLPGPFPVTARTMEAFDPSRHRLFPCEIWQPGAPAQGPHPLVVFSHSSGGNRRQSTFLCTHLASHGYLVAAMDHSEIVAPELARREGETSAEKAARIQAWIASRVPDIRFLLGHLLATPELYINAARIAIAGHSFGGWTALAVPEVDHRIQAVVALAPGGSSPRPGILPLHLTFDWSRPVPSLYLAAENDTSLPLDGMYELFERTPMPKQMVILRRADHLHFMDDVEKLHEAVRAMEFPPELDWLKQEIRPFAELCSAAEAHAFVRGLALSHLDATVRNHLPAQEFWTSGVAATLAARKISAIFPEKKSCTILHNPAQ